MMMTSETVADKLAFVTGIGEIGGYAEQAAQEAVREAERVLAEAEPASDPTAGRFTQRVHLDVLHDGLLALQGRPGKRYTIRTDEGQALAEALTAVLPVLDEMAGDCAFDAGDSYGHDPDAIRMWRRNRTTLAGMDEPESHSSRCPSRFMGECLCGVAERAGMEAGQ